MKKIDVIPPLRERVESSFRKSYYSAIRDICCDDYEGMLRLRGRLPSHYLKQLALATATEIAGKTPIHLEIRVDPSLGNNRDQRGHEVEPVADL